MISYLPRICIESSIQILREKILTGAILYRSKIKLSRENNVLKYYNTNLLTINASPSALSYMLDAWKVVQSISTDVQSVNGKTTVTVDGDKIAVDDLPEPELKPIVGHKVSAIKIESEYRWFVEGDQE